MDAVIEQVAGFGRYPIHQHIFGDQNQLTWRRAVLLTQVSGGRNGVATFQAEGSEYEFVITSESDVDPDEGGLGVDGGYHTRGGVWAEVDQYAIEQVPTAMGPAQRMGTGHGR